MKEMVLKGKNELTIKNLESYTESFIKYLDVDEKTIKTYRVGLLNFMNYLKENDIKYPNRDTIIAYRDMLRDNYSSNTVNTYMIALRRLFKYLEIHELYKNIATDIKGAKYSVTPKKQVLSIEQARNIYASLTDKRERAIFSLLITTGLRGIEVSRAMIEDIKMHNGEKVLWIQCKKHDGKDEYVKLSDKVIEDIKEYIGDRTSGYIFTSTSNHNNGGGITTASLRRIIKDIFKRFGLDSDTLSLHSTRRSCATIMYQQGKSVYDIQQVLHHVSESTTVRYINSVTRNENNSEYVVSNAILGGI